MQSILRSAVFWGVLGFGAGIAMCLLFLGRPDWWRFVWSSETAAWVSGAATVGAVWIAITSSRREHERTLALRDDEWQREDSARMEKAGTMAHAIHRELHTASLELQLIMLNTSPHESWENMRLFLSNNLTRPPLPTMSLFADKLDSFKMVDAVAILNALFAWRIFQEKIPEHLTEAGEARIRSLSAKIHLRASETITLYRDLQDQLLPYFKDLPGLKVVQAKPLPGLKEPKE